MQQKTLMEKYPIYELCLNKSETTYQSVPEIIEYFKQQIDAHPIVRYIGTFDHFAHTQSLDNGQVAEDIVAAMHVVFCFGVALPNPHVMAVRPRSIGVVEQGDQFVINFLEPPMEVATQAMQSWAKGLKNAS